MGKVTVHGGVSDGPGDANVTETDDPAVQAQVDARRASEAHDENALLKRKLREAEDREANAADQRERERKEREGQEQRTRDDFERLTKENEELRSKVGERESASQSKAGARGRASQSKTA